jgi:hypothetical protein
MEERDYLTQEELEKYGLEGAKQASDDDVNDYENYRYAHDYGQDTLSDINYDLDQDEILEGKLKKKRRKK